MLIYGLDREEVSFLPPDGPDYVTVVSVSGPQETPVPSEIPTSMNYHSMIIGNLVLIILTL